MDNVGLNLEHLYISPIESCNLSCKLCYTQKTKLKLSLQEIKRFIEQYVKALIVYNTSLQTITFCGGEFFLLDYAVDLINWSCEQGYFVQIITNGTVDKLSKIKYPNSVNLLVSVDGIEKWHDMNRGNGNFIKSIEFIKRAQQMLFHTEIFSLVWKENFKDIGEFEKYVKKELKDIPITYQLRKNISFLNQHPVTNVNNAGNEFGFLTSDQIKWLMNNKKTFPPKDLGCYQISLMSDGKVYSCCEGIKPLCEMIDDKGEMIRRYLKRVSAGNNLITSHCSLVTNCAEPEFCCGFMEK